MPLKSESELAAGLYIVATPIGNLGDISLRALDTLRKVDVVACEDTREAGKLTSIYEIEADKIPYHDHNAAEMRPKIISMLRDGKRVALISDAGMPLVSDPGYKLVENCIAEGFHVTCVPGATASLAALVLSGLPSDRFLFAGFLPTKSAARRAALSEVKYVPATLIFYETAPRLAESLGDMKEILGDRAAAVCRELTKKFEETRRATLSQLAAHYENNGAPKGEIVVVVAPPAADAVEQWTEETVDRALAKMMDGEGMSVKDASAFVAAQSGLKKSGVYQRALLLRNRKK
ncbi:MAG: 16S rRNA (cytidine(1402)-2'-O)-methyltransferase [Alphaproteobacteria bacterium]|nr:MAG: 16S rRNA (cytidine(1402)-2'-O)-methyltransferase [Alphaproteobacteria bacterium]